MYFIVKRISAPGVVHSSVSVKVCNAWNLINRRKEKSVISGAAKSRARCENVLLPLVKRCNVFPRAQLPLSVLLETLQFFRLDFAIRETMAEFIISFLVFHVLCQ